MLSLGVRSLAARDECRAGNPSARVNPAGEEDRQGGKQKPPPSGRVGASYSSHASRSPSREGVFVEAIEAGLLTDGSSYSPTPSRRTHRQWLILLAFVPAHSGAPVRELHPLPASSTSIAVISDVDRELSSGERDVKQIFFQKCLPEIRAPLWPQVSLEPLPTVLKIAGPFSWFIVPWRA